MTEIIIRKREELIKFLKERSAEDKEIKWICPKCGCENIGAHFSHETYCGGDGCRFRFPRLNLRKIMESEIEATAIAKEMEVYRNRIGRQNEIVEELESELSEEKRKLETMINEFTVLKSCDMEKVKNEW